MVGISGIWNTQYSNLRDISDLGSSDSSCWSKASACEWRSFYSWFFDDWCLLTSQLPSSEHSEEPKKVVVQAEADSSSVRPIESREVDIKSKNIEKSLQNLEVIKEEDFKEHFCC